MRTSNRINILQAVLEIIEREGMSAVTFDAVAAETGLTRGGLLYHFPSRESLLLATHQYAADQWTAEIAQLVGGGQNEVSDEARYVAYVKNSAEAARRVDFLLLLESVHDSELGKCWEAVPNHWAPPVPEHDDAASIRRFIARLAAEGLWLHEALSTHPVPPAVKQRLRSELVRMIEN